MGGFSAFCFRVHLVLETNGCATIHNREHSIGYPPQVGVRHQVQRQNEPKLRVAKTSKCLESFTSWWADTGTKKNVLPDLRRVFMSPMCGQQWNDFEAEVLCVAIIAFPTCMPYGYTQVEERVDGTSSPLGLCTR